MSIVAVTTAAVAGRGVRLRLFSRRRDRVAARHQSVATTIRNKKGPAVRRCLRARLLLSFANAISIEDAQERTRARLHTTAYYASRSMCEVNSSMTIVTAAPVLAFLKPSSMS